MRALTADDIRATLREHILGNYLFSDDPSALQDDESFQETRQIDSMGMMQLIQFIEREFEISVDESDLVPERLDSVNRLVALVRDKRETIAAAAGQNEPASVAAPPPSAPSPATPAVVTPRALPTIVDLLERSAADHPASVALITRESRTTYEMLWSSVMSAAQSLAHRGISRGDRVALMASHTAETVAAYYAILAAGAVVVPLDPQATPRELTARIGHTGARMVVTDSQSPLQPAVAAGLSADTEVASSSELASGSPSAFKRVPIAPGELAALVYTSGTTARPKAVMLTHANVATNVLAVIDYLGLTASDRVMSPLSLFYVYGASVLQTHLSVGASVVLGDMVFAERTVRWMADERVTGFSGVSWMYATLLSRTTFAAGPAKLPTLRYLTQAGSRMAPVDIARITAAFPKVSFFVMYGQTEATSRLCYLAPSDLPSHPGSVGKPINGVAIEIRRPDGSLADAGETGEVLASGPNVMQGYWQAPEATAKAILEDERGRWLRTGDLGHLDGEGYLFLEGRLSDIIKVWGHRVSPAEVEEVVLALPGVADAAAVGVPDGPFGEAIHLVVVRAPGASVTEHDVLAHCRAQLSTYKLPARVTFADAVPMTASGKLQRWRLLDSAEAVS